MPRGVWLVVYPGVILFVILAIKEETFSLWRDFGSPNQGISSLKRDLPGLPRLLSGKESACQCRTDGFDPTCLRATRPLSHDYWACALEPVNSNYWVPMPELLKLMHPRACVPQQEKPPWWAACAPQLESSTHSLWLEQSPCSDDDPAQPKINYVLKKGPADFHSLFKWTGEGFNPFCESVNKHQKIFISWSWRHLNEIQLPVLPQICPFALNWPELWRGD